MKQHPTKLLPRAVAMRIVLGVLHGRSLTELLQEKTSHFTDARDVALIKMLCYGMCRWYFQLESIANKLLAHPLKEKDEDIKIVILLGIFQLRHTTMPPHAVVSETVALCEKACKKKWAKGLVNAVLRNYLRRIAEIDHVVANQAIAHFSHPAWMIEKMEAQYGARASSILNRNNQHPPMALRVNCLKTTRDAYLAELKAAGLDAVPLSDIPCGILLSTPVNVTALPGFATGSVSVQGEAAQRAALLLAPLPGERVLDACAAPGGKTAHLLELQPQMAYCLALDKEPLRLARIKENLARAALQCDVKLADAEKITEWWDGQYFDAILLDAPCSASGVMCRHPDSKLLRRATDIPMLAETQFGLLSALWQVLKPGGRLLYATCSIFKEENGDVVQRFMAERTDVILQMEQPILPSETSAEGFYYALLVKK